MSTCYLSLCVWPRFILLALCACIFILPRLINLLFFFLCIGKGSIHQFILYSLDSILRSFFDSYLLRDPSLNGGCFADRHGGKLLHRHGQLALLEHGLVLGKPLADSADRVGVE